MRKRFIPILLLAALLLGLVPSASAAEHQFPAIYAAVTLPRKWRVRPGADP